jgi:hypothetical protein
MDDMPEKEPRSEYAVRSQHTRGAQMHIDQVVAMRDTIPYFAIPESPKDLLRVNSTASLPPEFIELTTVASIFSEDLRRVSSDPNRVRDLMDFADAYAPLAAEFEVAAKFLRYSINRARSIAGREALMTYELAKRLCKNPANGELLPHVEDMRRALGVRARTLKARAARRRMAAAAESPEPSEP